MDPSKLNTSHMRLSGAVSVAIAAAAVAVLSTFTTANLRVFAVAGAVTTLDPDAENALISTRVHVMDLSRLTPASYGD